MSWSVMQGNVRSLPLEDASVTAVVCDPPYELGFMGKDWDKAGVAFDLDAWREVLRVLKPGGVLMAFGGTRTYHRMTCAIEDAGFEIRDCLMWLYGSGFPKSFDVAKGIDSLDAPDATMADALDFTRWFRTAGVSRDQIREATGTFMASHYLTAGSQPAIPTPEHWAVLRPLVQIEVPGWVDELVGQPGRASENLARREVLTTKRGKDAVAGDMYRPGQGKNLAKDFDITAPFTDSAKDWNGWGTALKPAWEPIVLAMKPVVGTFARNALRHGVAGLNVDGARIGTDEMAVTKSTGEVVGKSQSMAAPLTKTERVGTAVGRWPANLVLDEDAAVMLDEQSGVMKDGVAVKRNTPVGKVTGTIFRFGNTGRDSTYGGEGGASRFFYTAKVSVSERHAGMERGAVNDHPTVKPVDLMRYLVRLVKMPGDTLILDPFMGSGSTGVACVLEGVAFVGVDLEEAHVEIARSRIQHFEESGGYERALDRSGLKRTEPNARSSFTRLLENND